jgi:hypothetical protein
MTYDISTTITMSIAVNYMTTIVQKLFKQNAAAPTRTSRQDDILDLDDPAAANDADAGAQPHRGDDSGFRSQFPNSFKVTGMKHIADNLLHSCLKVMSLLLSKVQRMFAQCLCGFAIPSTFLGHLLNY